MTRVRLSTVALLVLAAHPAFGQGFSRPVQTPPPVTTPGGRVVPWSPSLLPPIARQIPPIAVPWFGGLGYYSYGPSYPYTYDTWYLPAYDQFPTGPVAPAPQPAPSGPPAIVPELSAEWTLEFPASAEVTLNGNPTGVGTVRKLTSPPLKPGESYTFAVTAKWTADGKKYEWDRTLTLGSGQRSRTVVTRGFLVEK